MSPESILKALDFTPDPMYLKRKDGQWVSFCEEHRWFYETSSEGVAKGVLEEHNRLKHVFKEA